VTSRRTLCPRPRFTGLVLSGLLLAAVAPPLLGAGPAAAATPPVDAMQDGRELTRQFLARELDPLWARMAQPLRDAFHDRAGFGAFQQQVKTAGAETALIREQLEPHAGGFQVYVRVARFSTSAHPLRFQWALDGAGKIAGLTVEPAPEPSPK
jgi:hypothetical protein